MLSKQRCKKVIGGRVGIGSIINTEVGAISGIGYMGLPNTSGYIMVIMNLFSSIIGMMFCTKYC